MKMMILKYSTKFRLILYFGFILCIILVSTNPFWYNIWFEDSEVTSEIIDENETVVEISESDLMSDQIRVSEIYPNCGLRFTCPEGTFPVHIYTGQDKDDKPKLCIQGKYLAGGGRGLNFAVIEPRYLQLVSLRNFDLYSHNSSALEVWLSYGVKQNDIVIVYTFDEASKELSKKAKSLLYAMGSGKIQDLQYRSQWYMITQKQDTGFTPLETITYARSDRWGEAIDEKICVPRRIPKLPISPDPVPRKNPARDKFCSVNEEMNCEEFCGPLARHEPIIPSLLTNRSLIGNIAFSTPIIVISGPSLSSLALTLETLIYQPGIHSATVFVVYTEDQTDAPVLARIFGVRTIMFNDTYTGPNSKIHFGLSYIHNNFPKKKFAIAIEEGLILSPDYLYYMTQMAPILEKDETLLGVSAWNPYGYPDSSGSFTSAYRVEDFPGLGFLVRMDVFMEGMYDKMSECCTNKTFQGWPLILSQFKGGNIVIPGVSRVLKRPKDYIGKPEDDEFVIFTRPRVTNTNLNAYIDRPQDLTEDRYFLRIASLIDASITIHLSNEDLKLCDEQANIAMKIMLSELKNKIFALYYQEESCNGYDKLLAYMKCFNIFIPPNYRPQVIYKKVARFTIGDNMVLLIESSSPFAKNKKMIRPNTLTIS